MEAIILSVITTIPSLINAVNQMIARGKQSGELTKEQADALTAKANTIFAAYAQPAPPPPGV